jgi:cytochrome c2
MRSVSSRLRGSPASEAARRAAQKLALILIAIVLVLIPIYLYYDLQRDAEQRQAAIALTGGDPDRAPALLSQYGCKDCHTIPGIAGADGQVGPNLAGIAQRLYVGGVITNTPEHLISWIVDPQAIDPKSAMPRTGISTEEARDVAAYLYSRR